MGYDFSRRCQDLELIDQGQDHFTKSEYWDCLYQLGRIGKFLGGNRATLRAFFDLEKEPASILDVGCGGGTFTIALAKKYPDAMVVGIDTSEWAIEYAKEQAIRLGLKNLSFERRLESRLTDQENSFDVVTSTLVCHHMNDDVLVDFLQRAASVASHAVIINDLHRTSFAYYAFKCVSRVFFCNRLICHDGLLSVRRSFNKKDWVKYLASAEISPAQYQIKWKWAFRWILTIKRKGLARNCSPLPAKFL